MPRAPHSPARKLAIVALARLSGIEEAARVAGAQSRSVREWMTATGNDDPRLGDWQAARDYAMEQQLRATIEGNPSKAFAWSKSAGVSQRNVDMVPRSSKADDGEVIEEPSAVRLQLDRLDQSRGRLLAAEIRDELRADHPRPQAEPDTPYLEKVTAWVDALVALSDEDVLRRTSQLEAEAHERHAAEIREHEARRRQQEAERAADSRRGFANARNVTPPLDDLIKEGERMLLDLDLTA